MFRDLFSHVVVVVLTNVFCVWLSVIVDLYSIMMFYIHEPRSRDTSTTHGEVS